MTPDPSASPSRVPLAAGLLLWFVAALVIGATGLLARAPVPPPALAVGLAVLLLLVLWGAPALRRQVLALAPGPLVAFHLIRLFAGFYFLVLAGRGVLPDAFAVVAGWGDIVVGATALLVLWLCVPVRSAAQRRGLLWWNVLGLVDMLIVLANGARLFLRDTALAEPFLSLPLALLPTFVVPVVLVSHGMLFVWLRRRREAVA